MSEYTKFKRDVMERFPTKNERDLATGKIKELPTRLIYTYWTNFDRRYPNVPFKFQEGQVQDPPFWMFKTNLSPADIMAMPDGRMIGFFKRMWEIYRYRKTN